VNESALTGVEVVDGEGGDDTGGSTGGGDAGGGGTGGGEDEDGGNSTSAVPTGRPVGTAVPYIACLTPIGAGTGWRWQIYVADGRNASANVPLVSTFMAPMPVSAASASGSRAL